MLPIFSMILMLDSVVPLSPESHRFAAIIPT